MLEPPSAAKHRATGKPRGRPKGTRGANDERDWFIAATVAGGMLYGLGYAKSIRLACKEFHVEPDVAKRAYSALKGGVGSDLGLVPECAEKIAHLCKKHHFH
jgi:hypothetical protein